MKSMIFLTALVLFVAALKGNHHKMRKKDLQVKIGLLLAVFSKPVLKVLTFRADGLTTGVRSQPGPQLSYAGVRGSSCIKPRLVQCYNGGLEGQPIHWVCWAESEAGKRIYYQHSQSM